MTFTFTRLTRLFVSTLVAATTLFIAQGAKVQAQAQVPVNVTSTPSGAMVYLDDTSNALGTTPLKKVKISKGSHTLIFRLSDYQEQRLTVSVSKRNQTFQVTLSAMGTVDLNATSSEMNGATVTIDGEQVGQLPLRKALSPGRHMVQVTKQGFGNFQKWVDVVAGQALAIAVTLDKTSGSLIVSADVGGARVSVDGQDKGASPVVIDDLSAGPHSVEVRADGFPALRETVTVRAGERATFSAQLRGQRGPTGSINIISNVPGARIYLDGEDIGTAPVVKEDIVQGDHIIEAQARGYEPVQQTVSVGSNQRSTVSIRFSKQAPGTIQVDTDAKNATVLVDGQDRGAPPVTVRNASPGEHTIEIKAKGYKTYRTTCNVSGDEGCNVQANMDQAQVRVRIIANVTNAQAVIDGRAPVTLPYEGTFPAGSMRFEVSAEGYETHVEQVDLEPNDKDEPRSFQVYLVPVGESEAGLRLRSTVMTHGAAPMAPGIAALDLSVGWPYLFAGRLNVGVLDYLDAGFEVRTFGRVTEFEGRAKVGYNVLRQFGLGAQARLGGGIGSDNTNTLFLQTEGMASLYFSDFALSTAYLGLDFNSDKYGFTEKDSDIAVVNGDRQNTVRLRIGVLAEIVVTRYWNIWAQYEGVLAGKRRRIFGDILGLGNEDSKMYFRLGVTYKF